MFEDKSQSGVNFPSLASYFNCFWSDETFHTLVSEPWGDDDVEQVYECLKLFAAAEIFTMIDCRRATQTSSALEDGTTSVGWKEGESFIRFFNRIFPCVKHCVLSDPDHPESSRVRSDLKASNLSEKLNIKFRATHYIDDHLRYDRKTRTVLIFQHTAFLEEHLRMILRSDGSGSWTGKRYDDSDYRPKQVLTSDV